MKFSGATRQQIPDKTGQAAFVVPTAASCNLLHQPTPFLPASAPRCTWCDVKRAEVVDIDCKMLNLSRLSRACMADGHCACCPTESFMHPQAEGA